MSMDINDFAIDMAEVAKYEDLPGVVRNLAKRLMKDGYLTIGQWLSSIAEDDLDILSEMVEVDQDDETYEDASEAIVLMTLMLARSEGIYPESLGELSRYTGAFKMMVAGTTLARKGLVSAFYENMSFGDDAGNKVVFKRID